MAIDGDTLVRVLLRNRANLVAYAVCIVRDDHLAEDVFQDASVLAYKKKADITDEHHLMAWLRIVIRQRAIKALSKRSKAPLKFDNSMLDLLDDHWQQFDRPEADDYLSALRYCIDRLAPKARELVRLRYSDGMRGTKLAKIFNQPANSIYVALSRIHRTLAECVTRFINRVEMLND
jgi:RNA polymerase sigma-70 factor (ECF subfamily)